MLLTDDRLHDGGFGAGARLPGGRDGYHTDMYRAEERRGRVWCADVEAIPRDLCQFAQSAPSSHWRAPCPDGPRRPSGGCVHENRRLGSRGLAVGHGRQGQIASTSHLCSQNRRPSPRPAREKRLTGPMHVPNRFDQTPPNIHNRDRRTGRSSGQQILESPRAWRLDASRLDGGSGASRPHSHTRQPTNGEEEK